MQSILCSRKAILEKHSKAEFSRSCWCIRALKWIPVSFVIGIIGWSYYSYVVNFCLNRVETSNKIFYLIFFHLFFIPLFCSYLATALYRIATVPRIFTLPDGECELLQCTESEEIKRQILEGYAQKLPISNRTANGGIRYCEKCHCIKPDRAHHCSICEQCILKMDHHCPWINSCVNFNNYKCFLLFLFYSVLYCLYICATSLPYLVSYWRNDLREPGNITVIFLFFVPLMFLVSLLSLFVYHCALVFENRTTLESFRPPVFTSGTDKKGYDIGACNNFKEVFGNDVVWWFIPIKSALGDGCTFPRRYEAEESKPLLNNQEEV